MYIAKHYVRVNGHVYVGGERIPDSLTPEKIAWLLKAGAVVEAAPMPQEKDIPEDKEDFAPASSTPSELPDAAETVEEDAPEIDVMAGIVRDTEEVAKSKPRRKKPAERKKS